ncbi:restriction endonuclease subunit S [Mycoplasma mycoides]|uniref:restriction endonuclease subunit S n=1 Tax=Mycoplasma mycoides TaxID=2102 RepID=UPI0022405997|nr:restriction endonuclease subunit S [Mycoplasma mycoides]QVK06537.1 restriction endonuclease subunit S [Mycoplasma mycoides subsp. capri]
MKKLKLKDLLELKTGKEFKNKTIGLTPVYSSGGIISYINDYIVDFPTILLPRVGTLDSIFYVDNKIWVTDNMYYTKIRDDIVNPKYLYFYLRTIDFSNKHSKTTQPKMTIRDYYDINAPIPDKVKQDKIASFLNYIERKIKLNNKINDNLVKQIQNIYDNWFLKFNFPNDDNMSYKNNGGEFVFNEIIGEKIPVNWKVESIFENELTEIITPGIDKFEDKKMYYATKQIQNMDIQSGEYISYINRKSRANMQPISNSVWFAKMKNSIKHLFITNNMGFMLNNGILSTGFCGLKCNNDSFEYLASVILQPNFEFQKDSLSHGATQQSINNEDLKYIKLLVPDRKTLQKYHELTGPIFCKITENMCENIRLIDLKNILLPLLMNNQVTID